MKTFEPTQPGRRGDAQIALSARSALRWMTHFPTEWVQVRVEDGAITLSGEVDWKHQQQAAAGAVRFLAGVTDVRDHITIRPGTAAGLPGPSNVEAALLRRAEARLPNLRIEVQGRDMTLSGTVGSGPEREQARHAAWGTRGVRYVFDNLVVAY